MEVRDRGPWRSWEEAAGKSLREAALKFVERERAWTPGDRRGRWVVVERCPARSLFRNSPAVVRTSIARATPRRARRFSSLSRARAHAREHDGTVHRWSDRPPGGGHWQWVSAWKQALEMRDVGHLLGSFNGPSGVFPVQHEALVEGTP